MTRSNSMLLVATLLVLHDAGCVERAWAQSTGAAHDGGHTVADAHSEAGAHVIHPSAIGGLQGDTIGESFGYGGLGLTRGRTFGTSDGDSVGIGMTGTIGLGAGPGTGGSELGLGAGGFTGARSNSPRIVFGTSTVREEGLVHEIVRRIVFRDRGALGQCFMSNATLPDAGVITATVHFVILANGSVSPDDVRVTGAAATVGVCIAARVRSMAFPPPTDNAPVPVTQPITMTR